MIAEKLSRLADNERTPTWLLAAACALVLPVIAYFQRGTLLWADALSFISPNNGFSLSDMLIAHNGQFMPTTWFLFQFDSVFFHPGAQGIFIIASIASQFALVWGLYVWARRRIDPWYAAAGSLLILTYGAGSEVVSWSFNFGWVLALAAGVWALNVNDKGPDSTRNRVFVAGLLVLSLLGDNLGIVFCAAIGTQIFYKDTRKRALIIVLPILILWGLWYAKYAVGMGVDTGFHPKVWPYATLSLIQSSFGGFVFDMIGWAAPLTVLGTLVLGWRLWSLEKLTPQLVLAFAVPVTFVGLIVITRSNSDPAVSRYKYTLAVFLVVLFAEVLRGVRLRGLGKFLVVGAIVLFLAVGNLVWMGTGAKGWRNLAQANRDYYTALELAGRKAACNSAFNSPDPLIEPVHNCLMYDKMAIEGGQGYTAEELAKMPGAKERVEDVAKQVREIQAPVR